MKRSLALGLPEQPIRSREVLSSKLKQGHVCFLALVHVQASFLGALLLSIFLFFIFYFRKKYFLFLIVREGGHVSQWNLDRTKETGFYK
jgi:hypothetical protein